MFRTLINLIDTYLPAWAWRIVHRRTLKRRFGTHVVPPKMTSPYTPIDRSELNRLMSQLQESVDKCERMVLERFEDRKKL